MTPVTGLNKRVEKITEIGSLIGRRKKAIGALGEMLIVKHLTSSGFKHLQSNYTKKVGEIDVIMENAGVIHFIEVKSVSRERFRGVIHETREGRHLPEENVGRSKLRKMAKVIQMYLGEKRMMDKKWQFDVAVVYLELRKQKAHIRFIKDVLVAG